MSAIEKITGILGKLIENAIARKLDREAIANEIAAAIRREDIVSDELLDRVREYVDTTRTFEDEGA